MQQKTTIVDSVHSKNIEDLMESNCLINFLSHCNTTTNVSCPYLACEQDLTEDSSGL